MNNKMVIKMSEKRFTFYYERGNEVVIKDSGKRLSNKQLVDLLNELYKENEQLRKIGVMYQGHNPCSNVAAKLNELQSTISRLEEENEKLQKENEKIQEEIKELKIERDDWKSSTCSYMNKDSLLSMDCQIVQEALWKLEKEIEFGSKREDLFFDLKEKFEKLNNHRIGVYE